MRWTKLDLAWIQVSRSDNRQIQPVPLLCRNDIPTKQFHMVALASTIGHIDHTTRNSQPFKLRYNPKYCFSVSIIHIKTHKFAAPLASIHAYGIFLFQVIQQDASCQFAVCASPIFWDNMQPARQTQHIALSIGHVLISQPIQLLSLLIGHQYTSVLNGVYNIL